MSYQKRTTCKISPRYDTRCPYNLYEILLMHHYGISLYNILKFCPHCITTYYGRGIEYKSLRNNNMKQAFNIDTTS